MRVRAIGSADQIRHSHLDRSVRLVNEWPNMHLLGPARRTGAVTLSLGIHCTQSCVDEQTGVCVPEQFVLLRHSTHLVVVWSQYGVLPKH
jgi:hypothetical protein